MMSVKFSQCICLLFVCHMSMIWGSTLHLNKQTQNLERMKRAASVGVNNMVYYVHTGIQISQPNMLQRIKRQVLGDEVKPIITSLNIESNIMTRTATVVMKSEMKNPSENDAQATFQVMLPETAFMSNFTMLIDGELFVAEVESKDEAEKRYEEARERNETAGLVSSDHDPQQRVPGMERFKISVNVAGQSKIKFMLTYMELLRRNLGFYEQKISVRPGQVVDDLTIFMKLYEPDGVRTYKVIEPHMTNSVTMETEDTLIYQNGDVLEISYTPDTLQQKKKYSKDTTGLDGNFILRYDTYHDGEGAGLLQVENKYFAHFFSPGDITTPLNKNIVFVIDISGSMSGNKIQMTRESLIIILDQLRNDDQFMLLLFDDQTATWPNDARLVRANADNIAAAKTYVEKNVMAKGGTDINKALVTASSFLHQSEQSGSNMIMFLTDGDPTSGETNTATIQENVEEATGGAISIFSLGYGFNLRFDFLQAISYRNNAFATQIYEEMDVKIQLSRFYEEINTPVLYNVRMEYPKNVVVSVSQVIFAQYFLGSEIVVTGMLQEEEPVEEWECSVRAIGPENEIILIETVDGDNYISVPAEAREVYQPHMIERLYQYMKIKEYLRRELMTNDVDEQKQWRELATNVAIEYNLVTPVTSFVIVQDKPQDDAMFEDARAGGMMVFASAGYDGTNMICCNILLTLTAAVCTKLM